MVLNESIKVSKKDLILYNLPQFVTIRVNFNDIVTENFKNMYNIVKNINDGVVGILQIPSNFLSITLKISNEVVSNSYFVKTNDSTFILLKFSAQNNLIEIEDEQEIRSFKKGLFEHTIQHNCILFNDNFNSAWFFLTNFIDFNVIKQFASSSSIQLNSENESDAPKLSRIKKFCDKLNFKRLDQSQLLSDLIEEINFLTHQNIQENQNYEISTHEKLFLGFYQFVFIDFIEAYNYEAFEIWKIITSIISNAERIAREPLGLIILDYLKYMYYILPNSFYLDVDFQDNFVIRTLINTIELFSDFSEKKEVHQIINELHELIKEKLSMSYHEVYDLIHS